MLDINSKQLKLKQNKAKEKRRLYMREYYRKKKAGVVKPKKKKPIPQFTIKRGEFIVRFD